MEFNLGLLQIEACEETSIVPMGSDIEILPSAKNNSSSSKDKHVNVVGSLKFEFFTLPWSWVGKLREDKFDSNWDQNLLFYESINAKISINRTQIRVSEKWLTNKSINPAQIRPFQPILSCPDCHFSSKARG